jgi:S1-C subfamily serine protease
MLLMELLGVVMLAITAFQPTPNLTLSKQNAANEIDIVRPAIVQVSIRITDINRPQVLPVPKPIDDCFRENYGTCVLGTGFFVNADGDVVTACHVANDVQQIIQTLGANGVHAIAIIGVNLPNFESKHLTVSSSTQIFPSTVTAVDPKRDLATFHPANNPFTNMRKFVGGPGAVGYPEAKADFLRLGISRPRDGDEILACGFPFGESGLVTTAGAIASAWKTEVLLTAKAAGLSDSTETYWVDLRINPGNSGGPVVRIHDHAVLGIVVESRGSLGMVVPAKYIVDFLKTNAIKCNLAGESTLPKKAAR